MWTEHIDRNNRNAYTCLSTYYTYGLRYIEA